MNVIKLAKKNLSLLIIVCVVICFNLIAHTLWSKNFCTEGSIEISVPANTAKTGVVNTILTGSKPITKPKLSTNTNSNKNTTSGKTETTSEEGTKLVLGGVSAGYEGETEYERARNQIIKLGISYEIAEHITWEAYTNTSGAKQFIKSIIGVSNAEGSMFKRGMYNNYLGVMLCTNGECSLRKYDTVQLAITHWREMYNRNKWYVRTTAQRWLDGKYCASSCTHRVQNYNEGIYLLNI